MSTPSSERARTSGPRAPASAALSRIREAADQFGRQTRALAPEQEHPVAEVVRRLDAPLHVAVAGRVKAGKSTLVNAFLGQRVARTDATECTRAVTWFRYGPAEQVTVVTRNGEHRVSRLDAEGLVPADLGVPAAEVASVQVELSLGRLRNVTVADTPGLASPDAVVSNAAEGVLGLDPDSQTAIRRAEAVLYVMNQTVREGDLQAIRNFRSLARAASDPVSTFGVLNKADLFDGLDPFATGARIAARHANELRSEVATVVAYSGLLAEAACCGTLTEADAHELGVLAASNPEQRDRMLLSATTFCQGPSSVPAEHRRRLWSLLREAGLREAFGAFATGEPGVAALRTRLYERSGHTIVDRHVSALFEANASVLKAAAALDDLEAIAWRAGGEWGEAARDHLEALRLHSDLHVLTELGALRQVRGGEAVLPPDLERELALLVAGGPLLPDGLARWRAFANNGADPAAAHVARTMVRSYELAGAEH